MLKYSTEAVKAASAVECVHGTQDAALDRNLRQCWTPAPARAHVKLCLPELIQCLSRFRCAQHDLEGHVARFLEACLKA